MAKSEKSMVPFLSLICKEFEPPAPYDTNVEFMPTMQFIGPPKTLLLWFFDSLSQYLKIDLFKDYASPSIYYICTNTDPNDKEAKQGKEFYESRLKMMQEGNYIEEEEENDAENGEENDEETGSEEPKKAPPKEEFMYHYERLCRGESNKVCVG